MISLPDSTLNTHCQKASETLEITVSFPIYVIAISTFVGWFVLILFLGSGLIALPFDYINSWRFRPKPMKEDEFERTKSELAKKVEKLLQVGKQLLEDKTKVDAITGCKIVIKYLNYCSCGMETKKICGEKTP